MKFNAQPGSTFAATQYKVRYQLLFALGNRKKPNQSNADDKNRILYTEGIAPFNLVIYRRCIIYDNVMIVVFGNIHYILHSSRWGTETDDETGAYGIQ